MYQAKSKTVLSMVEFILKCLVVMTASVPMASFARAQHTIEGIAPTTVIIRVVLGLEVAEGPAFDHEGNLYFTDFPKNRIYRRSRSGKTVRLCGTQQAGEGFDGQRREHSQEVTK